MATASSLIADFIGCQNASSLAYIVDYSSYTMIFMAVVTFFATLNINAPYGRYSEAKGWGPLIHPTIAWIIMESPNIWIVLLLLNSCGIFSSGSNGDGNKTELKLSDSSIPNMVLISYFMLHYLHRALIFPLRNTHGAKFPLSVMFMAFFYCTWNGLTQGLTLVAVKSYPNEWLFDPRFIVGSILFFLGMFINISSDYYLQDLKKQGKGYQIPRGGIFELVSGGNFFGEILEWSGFAVACWSLPAAAFALYTFSNVATRAVSHHKHYQNKFKEEYPKNRKAVLPFLW